MEGYDERQVLEKPAAHESSEHICSESRHSDRIRFSSDVRAKLNSWVQKNLRHPYMGINEKKRMARKTGLTVKQITLWLINVRRVT